MGSLASLAILASAPSCTCRGKNASSDAAAASGSADAASSEGAIEALPRFERFIDARLREDGEIDLAGVTRDNRLVFARARALPDGTFESRGIHSLATDFVATEETSIVVVRGGLAVALGKIGGKAGNWLVGTTSPQPREIGEDWCSSGGGVAWLAREEGGARVFYVHSGVTDATSGLVGASPDAEVHLSCGPDALVVSVVDGENLTLARLRPGTPAFATAPPLVVMEKEGELEDELRERVVVARGGDDVVVVRIGERKVWMRELVAASTTPTAWSSLATTKDSGEPGKAFRLDADADVIDVEASPSGGPSPGAPITWLLASEPMRGSSCKDGDPPRRIVLHSLKAGVGGEPGSETRRPIVELACGVEAIAAHLTADGDLARMWWSEPIADGSCAFPGLAVGAAIEATSDKPGARRHALVAEGVTRIADGRFIAVVREGGCASYDAAGNGALKWIGN
jgi:hypothetical protein